MKKYTKKARYLFEYFIYRSFVCILKLIGFKNSVTFCASLAKFIGPKLGVSKIAKKNLNKVFGHDINTPQMIEQIWDNFGRYIGEFPFINDLSDEEMNERMILEGLENINPYLHNSKPFLLFLAHQANWDFVIRHITKIYPKFAIIYRKANNPYVDKRIFQSRDAGDNILMIAKGPSGAKSLVRAIKDGYSICMLVDQKMNDGIEVPFFGMPAMTANAIAKLSLQYDYPIIPCQLIRLSDSRFKGILHPKIEYKKTKDKEKDSYNIMLKINQYLESWIKQNPTQWFWFHNRWKD